MILPFASDFVILTSFQQKNGNGLAVYIRLCDPPILMDEVSIVS